MPKGGVRQKQSAIGTNLDELISRDRKMACSDHPAAMALSPAKMKIHLCNNNNNNSIAVP